MNIGYEDDEIKPYREPTKTIEDKRIGMDLCGFPQRCSPPGAKQLVKPLHSFSITLLSSTSFLPILKQIYTGLIDMSCAQNHA